jgi:hypothetical protein
MKKLLWSGLGCVAGLLGPPILKGIREADKIAAEVSDALRREERRETYLGGYGGTPSIGKPGGRSGHG